jgi:hypothetical protein
MNNETEYRVNINLSTIFYLFGSVFFFIASLYLLGANTMALFN